MLYELTDKLQFVGPYVTRAFQHARPDVANSRKKVTL